MQPKVLFILKRRSDYSTDLQNFGYPSVATGMYNSAAFVCEMLQKSGIKSKLVTVIDNNDIDREVHAFKPTHAIIEGFWVVPEKFDVLVPLHPKVKWVIRCHSELPFLAQEGNAMNWLFGYTQRGVTVSPNSPRALEDLRGILRPLIGSEADYLTPLLPNYYPTEDFKTRPLVDSDVINVSCFGALRPLKNQLIQAMAAIVYAEKHGKKLNFHVNSGRVEQNGASGIKNIHGLFANHPKHTLIEHGWTSHEEFVKTLEGIDLSLQTSFTETFNIVSADALSVGTPTVVSSEVPYTYPVYASPNDLRDIVKKMEKVWRCRKPFLKGSKKRLQKYNRTSREMWLSFLLECSMFTDDHDELLAPAAWKRPFYSAWLELKNLVCRW